MKLARASQAEIDKLMKWLQARENAKFENAKDRPPAFMRVVFGYETLVDNCCDKTLDHLEFSPELLEAKKDKARLDWIEKMAANYEGRILTRLFLPDGKPFREKVDTAMIPNPI